MFILSWKKQKSPARGVEVSLYILCTDKMGFSLNELCGNTKIRARTVCSPACHLSLMVTSDGATTAPQFYLDQDLPVCNHHFLSEIINTRWRNGWIMIFSETNILTDKELRKLREHVYSSSCASLLDPLMQKYWNWWETKSVWEECDEWGSLLGLWHSSRYGWLPTWSQ